MFVLLFSVISDIMAQGQAIKKRHEVKRKETIFGIARDNGITIQELINANPEMNAPGYELKKGDFIRIPYPAGQAPKVQAKVEKPQTNVNADMRLRALRVGVDRKSVV